MARNVSRSSTIDELKHRLRLLDCREIPSAREALSMENGPLARLLFEREVGQGTLIEWLGEDGAGVGIAALLSVRPLLTGGACVVIDPAGEFYPPALAALGIELAQTIVVRPEKRDDVFWACEQSLRCPGVTATLCPLEQINDRTGRRLQLAAETGGGVGLLLRPASVRGQPSWADMRLLVEPLPSQSVRRLRISLLRCRNGTGRGAVTVELHDDTDRLHLVSELADPAGSQRTAGA